MLIDVCLFWPTTIISLAMALHLSFEIRNRYLADLYFVQYKYSSFNHFTEKCFGLIISEFFNLFKTNQILTFQSDLSN